MVGGGGSTSGINGNQQVEAEGINLSIDWELTTCSESDLSLQAEIILVFWMLGGAYSTGVDYSSERAAIRQRVSELVRSIVGDYIMDVHPRLVRCVFATADDAVGPILGMSICNN